MSWLRTLPIRRRLTAFVMLVTAAAVCGALVAAFLFALLQWRGHFGEDIATLDRVVASNAAGALAFQRPDEARNLLATLRAHEEIARVRIVDLKGAVFAEFDGPTDAGPFVAPAPGRTFRIRGFRLYAEEPVTLAGETYGAVQITADLRRQLTSLALVTGAVLLGVLAVALGFAYFLSSYLQRTITGPIFALSATAREVAQRQDYSLRAEKRGEDEIGTLTDAFNRMLAEIQQRDLALRRESEERLRTQEENRNLERQLEQKQRLESLGVLAGGIAHDFNNILTGILCSATLGRMETPRGTMLDGHLERVEQNARRAAELCEQMLAYAGKGKVSAKVLDLNVLARETLELLHGSLPSEVDLEVLLDPAVPAVKGDGARLRQVMMNLVLNAAESLQGGERRVRLKTSPARLDAQHLREISNPEGAGPGDFAVIEVADTGVGIEPERLRRIFEPFHTSKFAGRGLGLSAVLGIIRGANGALDVTSLVGKGTVFRIFFPATDDPPAPAGGRQNGAKTEIGRGRSGGAARDGTVIVVDDEAAVRTVAGDVLTRMGFSVVATSGGVEAMRALESHGPEVVGVLLDLTMPGMDGVTTLQAMRKLRPDLKAVLMSGFDQRDTLPRLEAMGFSAFIPKPFTPDMLFDLAEVLRPAAAR